MRNNRKCSFLLALLLCLSLCPKAGAAGDTVVIGSAEDLLLLAGHCALDSWSEGRTVVLAGDVSLSGVAFRPIPSFSGTFDGRGYTISGLELSEKDAPAGLFALLHEGALVKNLNVSGAVTPSGAAVCVGGIAGENRGTISDCAFAGTVSGKDCSGGIAGRNTGTVERCSVSGGISGKSMTGGLVGENLGTVTACVNRSYVNISGGDPRLDLSEFELSDSLLTLRSLDAANIATDTGGVAGYSGGTVSDCVNEGPVGYPHVGYNVGGVAGRSDGVLTGCSNRGQVFGRKDVGGVAGQAEPDVTLRLSGDDLEKLRAQINELQTLINRTANDAEGLSGDFSNRFQAINDCIDAASGQLDSLSERVSAYGGDVVSELDRGSEVLASALDDLSGVSDSAGGLSEQLTNTLAILERSVSELSGAGDYTGALADDLASALDSLSSAVDALEDGKAAVRNGLKTAREALRSFDLRAAWAALKGPVKRGIETLRSIPDELSEALARARRAASDTGGASGQAQNALDTLGEALDALEDASRQSETVFDNAGEMIDRLAGTSPINLERPDTALEGAADGLFDALTLLGTRLDALNGLASASVGTLANDARALNAQFGVISDTLFDLAYGLEETGDREIFTDVSDAALESITRGKLYACANDGPVNGDLCVGGVAGSLAIEHELDPEDDALSSDAPARLRTYEWKAVLQNCVNRGEVTARKDYAGSVCGRISLGLAAGCEGYGPVCSENGDYVGGVAGYSSGTIRACWSKCVLSGGRYVGGIVGDAAPDGGVVQDCRAYVRAERCEQYAGAIAGTNRGSFRENLFVDNGLAGLGTSSIAGQAGPASFESLCGADAPEGFRKLTLRFLADGEVLRSLTFDYGDSFDESAFPELPEREGEYARWEPAELNNLTFDTDVEAVYTPFLTALPSGRTRSDGRPVFFVEGEFDGDDALGLSPAQAAVPFGASALTRRTAVEQWELSIPYDGAAVHTLRWLSPTGRTARYEVYTLWNGVWSRVETEPVGGYLTFPVEGGAPVLSLVSTSSLWWVWALAAIALASVVLILWRIVSWLRRRVKKGEPDPRRVRRRVWTIVLAVSFILLAGGVYVFGSGVLDRASAAKILYDYAKRGEHAMDLSVRAEAGGRKFSAETALTRSSAEGRRVLTAEQFGTSFYYCDGALYLESGAAFQLGALPGCDSLLDGVRKLFDAGDSTVFRGDGEVIYSLSVDEAGVASLFPALDGTVEVERMDIGLAARDGVFYELRFEASGILSSGQQGTLSAKLTDNGERAVPPLPEAVREAIRAGGPAEDAPDLLRLLLAWSRLNLTDPLTTTLTLSADCGPLVIKDETEFQRTWTSGAQVDCIRKAGRTVYLSNGKLYAADGSDLDMSEAGDALSRLALPDRLCRICLGGSISCEEREGAYVYRLIPSTDDIAVLARELLPETASLDFTFTEGVVEAVVRNGELESVSLSCGGTLRLLFASVPASVSAELTFAEAPFTLPDAVAEAVERAQ